MESSATAFSVNSHSTFGNNRERMADDVVVTVPLVDVRQRKEYFNWLLSNSEVHILMIEDKVQRKIAFMTAALQLLPINYD